MEQLLAEAAGRGEPAPELFVVVGADLVAQLPSWERVDDLRRLVTLVVVRRPGSPEPEVLPGWRTVTVEGVALDLSSSEIRSRLEAGDPVEGMLPEPVVHCILARDLYARGR